MREIDITKQDIRCCDSFDFVEDNNDEINISYELWFDVDKYFGTNTSKNDSTWVNFYTSYHKDGTVTAVYVVDTDTSCDEFEWDLTENEKTFFKGMMQTYCNCKCGCTLDELFNDV